MTSAPANDGLARRIIKNIGLLFGGKTSAALIGLLVLGIAARALSIEALGSLLLLHAFVTMITGVATFKSWQALIQFGTGPEESGDITRFHRLLRFTIGLDLTAALVAAILSVIVYVFVHPFLGLPDHVFGYAIAYCLVSATNFRSTPLGVLRLHDRFDLISLYDQVVPMVRLVGAALGLFLGAGLEWFILVWLAASLATNIVMPVFALRELSRRGQLKGLFSQRPTLRAPEQGIWRFAWMSNIDATVDLSDKQMPTLLAGILLGPAFAAMYKIAQDVANVLAKGARLLNQVLFPELVRLVIAGQVARAMRIILTTSAYLLGIGLLLSALISVFGPAFFAAALDDIYADTASIATMLVIAAALMGAAAPIYSGLYALGKPGRATLARAITVGITLGLFVFLSLRIGHAGPGWAMVIGQTLGLITSSIIIISGGQSAREAAGQAARSDVVSDATNSGSLDPPDKSG